MSITFAPSHAGHWGTLDFAWIAPALVMVALLIGTIAVLSSFPAPTTIGPDGLLAFL